MVMCLSFFYYDLTVSHMQNHMCTVAYIHASSVVYVAQTSVSHNQSQPTATYQSETMIFTEIE